MTAHVTTQGHAPSPDDGRPDLERIVRHTPACLRQRHQWVCWRYVTRDPRKGPTKVPINPANGQRADATDPQTWSSFEEAIAAARAHRDYAGVGFVFTADDVYCGVDLDDCLAPAEADDAAPVLKPWARDLVDRLASYTEVSPSGGGLKVFLRGSKPGGRCRKGYHDGEVEIYDRDRFFTVTGCVLPEAPDEVHERQEQLDHVYRAVFGDDDVDGAAPATTPTPPSPPARGSDQPRVYDDDHIVELASGRSNGKGDKFADLWAGHWNNHFNSPSEADSSLVFTLAFYTKDPIQLDRLFRASGLMRDKWDERRGEKTYGQTTIDKALSKVTRQYDPGRKNKRRRRASQPVTTTSGEPPPGTIDPASGRLVLSTQRTQPTAEAFIRQFHTHVDGPTLRHYAGMLVAWQENRYVQIEDAAVRHRLLPWMHQAVRMVYDGESKSWLPHDFPANPTTINAALDSVRMVSHLDADTPAPSWLHDDGDQPEPAELLPCRTHTLHLPTMRRIEPTPNLFTLSALDYDPDPTAAVPERWLTFLGQLLGEDYQAWDLLQEWFGYCLTGDTSQHKMLLMVGPKRSGKGTIARVLSRLVGSANVAGPTTSGLAGPFGLQPLVGKSLAIVSDARFSGDGIQTVIERLLCISGEDTLTIERKHMTSVTMKLPTRFMFLTNELPRLNDASGALAGRFMMIKLTESFYGREDKTLTKALLDELPGILNWAIEGWKRLRERGYFIQPASVEDALHDMEDLASPVSAFVRDRCVVGSGHRAWVDDLYAAWRQWCESEGRTAVTTKQTFGRDLLAACPSLTCRRNRGAGRFYDGIGLVDGGVL